MVEKLHCCVGLCRWKCDGEGKCGHKGKEELGGLHRRKSSRIIGLGMRC